MSSTRFNFIVLKVNDIDCTNLSHDEIFQIFIKAEDTIFIKARRRRADDGIDKLYLFDDDWINSLQKYHTKILENTTYDSAINAGCRTEVPPFCLEPQTPVKGNHSVEFCQRSFDARSIFAQCFAPEIDVEEVTLRKSRSDEKLGLTVSYSSINGSTSISASDEDDLDSDEVTTENDEDNADHDTCADIYICDILPDSIAARDGRLRQGDQIIQINGKDVSSKDETESLLAENKNSITLLVSRCICTDDEFLDSAVYCDEKDQNTGMSISLDCEPSTYSSKSSLPSLSEAQKQQMPVQPIASLDTTFCDHAYIRAQLESVNKEISLLNSQISNLKIQKDIPSVQSPQLSLTLTSSSSPTSVATHQLHMLKQLSTQSTISAPTEIMKTAPPAMSSQKKSKTLENLPDFPTTNKAIVGTGSEISQLATGPSEKNASGLSTARTAISVLHKPSKEGQSFEIEHIYETIPEDSDTDSYYCSPYDGHRGQIRIEQWLKSQDTFNGSNTGKPDQKPPSPPPMNTKQSNPATMITQRDLYSNQTTVSRMHKKTANFDDYENSSSAYNTGDSCTSNPLTLELMSDDKNQSSSSTLVFRPYSAQLESYDNCKQCQMKYRKAKTINKTPKKFSSKDDTNNECVLVNRSHPSMHQSAKNVSNAVSAIVTRPCKTPNKLFRKAVTQNQQNFSETIGSNNSPVNSSANRSAIVIGSDGQQVVQSVHVRGSSDSTNHKVETTPMVWKVKRRTDGTRYIVRRPVRHGKTSTPTRNQRIQQYAQQHELQQNQDQIICTTTGGGVLIKDEIITITESLKSSSYRHMTSYKQTDNRHVRPINEKTKDRRHSAQYKQQRQDSSVSYDQTSSTSAKMIQKQWVI